MQLEYLTVLTGLAACAAAIPNVIVKRQGTACASLTAPEIPGATVVSVNGTEAASDSNTYCGVTVVLTHGDAGDNVQIITWLPTTDWNGLYQGTGGGGFIAGGFVDNLVPAIAQGYAASTTDAGLPQIQDPGLWADDPQLVTNFAYLSIHEMTVVGKALTEQFYGTPARNSFWNGCSTGGRQGYMEAQRYPEDYQGIYGGSPAINFDRFQIAQIWPYVVQNEEGEFVPQCVFDAFTNGAIAFCDPDDNGLDKLISNPSVCKFDASTLINQTANCNGSSVTITARQAKIFKLINDGPVDTDGTPLFYGIAEGASYATNAGRDPSPLPAGWVTSFIEHDQNFDFDSITYENFPDIFHQSEAEFKELIGTDNPDLSAFRDAGGKLISWHGWADPLIGANGTVDYRLRVENLMGGAEAVDEFYRLFMAPGVFHCGGGGPQPTDPFGAVVAWVENGTVPDTLAASGGGQSRNLCPFPSFLRYTGTGDITQAASWTCA